ncbi:MAG: four helix bundle protein [Thermodesulfobacteriota bacterium]|nr:four helix bundle protein [Thermodesulfobacteriota bacterium]
MATIEKFEEIEVWKKARELTSEIYTISNRGAFLKDYGLRDQIRRACISIMANIAEGFERGGTGEFLQFLGIAKGSTGEVRTHLYIGLDQGYINKEMFERLYNFTNEIGGMVGRLMNYLRKTKIKGVKYKP